MRIAALAAGLTHDEFWRLTPHEVMLSIKAHARNFRSHKLLTASIISSLMGCWVKNAPSVNKLMGATSLMGKSSKEIKEIYQSKGGA